MNTIQFSLPEILALLGVIQCTYLIVHIGMRFRQTAQAGLPLLYFLVLGAAFTADLAYSRLGTGSELYSYAQWFLWFAGPPLSVLLIIRLANVQKLSLWTDFWVLLLLPLSFVMSHVAAETVIGCGVGDLCPERHDLLQLTGVMAGTISLLVIFSKKNLLTSLPAQKHGKERYWLIFSLISLNVLFLLVMLMNLMESISTNEALLLRNILGIGFVYLVGTTFLRIIPRGQKTSRGSVQSDLSDTEQALAQKVENLLALDKVYQEPTYSRADLARECQTSETVISRVINVHFEKSFRQLMNDHRIKDAKQLLAETQASIQAIAKDVGFNSLPSFNRVFKDTVGVAPSQYRKTTSQNV